MHGGSGAEVERALRRLARVVAASDLDSAAVLFEPETIIPASRFRETLARLAARCSGGTLGSITASSVIAAQRDDPFTIEALCVVAGLSYKELTERVEDLPAKAKGPFGPSQVRRAFGTLAAIVSGETTTDLAGTVPAHPLELMSRVGLGRSGWEAIEKQRVGGVPYEILLAQRAAGGAWLAHRNRTSGKLTLLLADRLCRELDARGVSYQRSTGIGGDITPSRMAELSGADKQLGLLVLGEKDEAAFGVIFSSARDSGTASKNASRLRAMRRPASLPVAVVVAGPGWAARNETANLAKEFAGRLYSERAIEKLADEIAVTV